MNRQDIIDKTMSKLAMNVKQQDNQKIIKLITDGKVKEKLIPRYIFSYAKENKFNDDQRLKLMQDLVKAKVQDISPEHKQGMEYLRDKMFKIPRASLTI